MMWHITLNIKLPDQRPYDSRDNQRDFIYYIEEQIRTILDQRFRRIVDISYHTDYIPDPVENEFERMYLNKWYNDSVEELKKPQREELRELLEEKVEDLMKLKKYQRELRELLEEKDLLPKDFIEEKEMEL